MTCHGVPCRDVPANDATCPKAWGQKMRAMSHSRLSSVVTVPLLILLSSAVHGQFLDRLMNPKLTVPVKHAPGLGLQVNKIAFGAGSGEGADTFIDQLTERFVSQNIEVLERERLQSLLREQNFSLSGSVDRATAAQLGRIVGPAVMVFVTAQRYTTEQKRLYNDWTDRQRRPHRTYIARTSAYVRISVRSVDLATGRIFAAKLLEATPVVENKLDDQGWPEYPDSYRVLDGAMNAVVEQATRLYLPWTSQEQVYFFDDKDCDLKVAYARLKTGDVPGALELSLRNLDTCKALTKPDTKALAHAYHNVGTAYFLQGDYTQALTYLRSAQGTKPSNIYVEAMQVVNTAAGEAQSLQRVEEQMTMDAEAAAQRQAATDSGVLTNKDIVELSKAQLPAALVIAKIKSSTCRFDTSADAMIALRQAGVADDVIVAMMGCKLPAASPW